MRAGRSLITELDRARLITAHQPGRYQMHDLLRAYATELAEEIDTPAERQAALERYSLYYWTAAHEAHLQFKPPLALEQPYASGPDRTAIAFADEHQALTWFSAEHRTLTELVRREGGPGQHSLAWRIALTMHPFYQRSGMLQDWFLTAQAGLAAAVSEGDQRGEALMHRTISAALFFKHDYAGALRHLRICQALLRPVGSLDESALVHSNLGLVLRNLDNHLDAIRHERRALAYFRRTGHRKGEANSLVGVARSRAELGGRRKAAELVHEAMAIFRSIDDLHGVGYCWDQLASVHELGNDIGQELICRSHAIAAARQAATPFALSLYLLEFGDACLRSGDTGRALSAWSDGLDALGDDETSLVWQLRTRLAEHSGHVSP
jgi:tetratricopeptide (TPR) repeat protein